MKPINKTVFLVLICLFVFSSCDEKQKANTSDQLDNLKEFTISPERANQLKKDYISTRANFLNAYLDSINYFENYRQKGLTANNGKNEIIEDVRDVTFDLKILKKYIAYVEKKAKKKGLKGLGLRVYLASYPKNDSIQGIHAGFSTVLFMPTHQKTEEPSNEKNFFYWFDDELMEDVDALNMGQQGMPPND